MIYGCGGNNGGPCVENGCSRIYLLINSSASSFSQQMQIETIPRYILIDKEGNIVDRDAPRPSDPKLKELIDKYLQ